MLGSLVLNSGRPAYRRDLAMTLAEHTLLIPERVDAERDAVARAWIDRGGEVVRLARFWEPPEVDPERVRVYGNDTFCLVLGEKLGLTLHAPPDDLLLLLRASHLKRAVAASTLDAVSRTAFPLFVKPMVPKQFAAGVHEEPGSVETLTSGLPGDTPLLVSEVVPIVAEARAFVLHGSVRAVGIYEGAASMAEAVAFLETVADDVSATLDLPTYVLDAALTSDRGWIVVEANPTWGAGLNGCEAEKVIDCINAASSGPDSKMGVQAR